MFFVGSVWVYLECKKNKNKNSFFGKPETLGIVVLLHWSSYLYSVVFIIGERKVKTTKLEKKLETLDVL